MINIKSQSKGLNLQTDTDFFEPVLLFVPLGYLGYLLFIIHYIFFIIYYHLFLPCQNKTVMYTSHSAFDFLVTPTCCILCAACLKLRMWVWLLLVSWLHNI